MQSSSVSGVFLELFNHQVLPRSLPKPLSFARAVDVHLKPSRNTPALHNSAASSLTAPACCLLLIHPCIEVSLDNEECPMSLIKDRAGWGTGKANSHTPLDGHSSGSSILVRQEVKQPWGTPCVAPSQEEAHLPKKGSRWETTQPWGVLHFLSGFVVLTQLPPVLGSFLAAAAHSGVGFG